MRTALVVMVIAAPASAHFVLEQPPSAFTQNAVGDPQKRPPCGNESSTAATNAETTVVAGETLTVRLRETIFHPGHYRVAIGVTGPSALPDPAPVTAGATPCGSAPIEATPTFPVLVDGALVHSRALSGAQTISVPIPSTLRCTRCTLQVIQFMSDHALNVPGGCYYHHCATVTVVGPDAGVARPDAGAESDAGVDAGVADVGDGGHHHHDEPATGCGCTQSTATLGLIGLLGLVLQRVRRPRCSP